MGKIVFPGLNLGFEISKIAFNIFGITIYWYAVLIVLALIIALILFKKRDGLYGISFDNLVTFMLYAIPICFICARIYYVMFSGTLTEIVNFRDGGLAIYGGIIGGIITCYIFCKKKKISVLDLTDYIAPALSLRAGYRKMGEFHKH